MKKPLTFGSLFAGIGGIDLGLERAGMQCAWQVEINPYARSILEKHWPDVARFPDVCAVGQHNLPPVDLIAGGFPCQDISDAGKRAGITGKRSGLWSEFARLIRELRPRFILVENVPALLKRGISRVLGDLAQSGYDAEWQSLPAAAFGAPHVRERLFLLAYDHRLQYQRCFLAADSLHATKKGFEEWEKCHRQLEPISLDEWPDAYAELRRGFYGIPRGMDRLRALGNAVIPQVAEYIGHCIVAGVEA